MKKIILTATAIFCITCMNAQPDTSGRQNSQQNTSEIPNVMYRYSDHGDNSQDGQVQEPKKSGQRSDTVRYSKNHKTRGTTNTSTDSTNKGTARRKKTNGTNPSGPNK